LVRDARMDIAAKLSAKYTLADVFKQLFHQARVAAAATAVIRSASSQGRPSAVTPHAVFGSRLRYLAIGSVEFSSQRVENGLWLDRETECAAYDRTHGLPFRRTQQICARVSIHKSFSAVMVGTAGAALGTNLINNVPMAVVMVSALDGSNTHHP
jgi:hypothetical protein